MFEDIKSVFIQIINSVHWMDTISKQAAIEHLENIVFYIGAPDIMLNQSNFESLLQYDSVWKYLHTSPLFLICSLIAAKFERHQLSRNDDGNKKEQTQLCRFSTR